MVSAIGSSPGFSSAATGSSAVGLEAQLARYQKVLSECVSCDSAKTREGKQNIQDVSSKISAVKARIEELAAAKSNAQPVTLGTLAAGSGANGSSSAPGAQDGVVVAAPAASQATATLGNRLDVFA